MSDKQSTAESGQPPKAASAMPVLPPVSAIFELVAMIALINFVDWLLPNSVLADAGPSPYWLPVLLLSLQYGTVSGLFAAAAAILLTMLPGVPEQGVGENHFAYLLRIWAQPILWIAVAVLVGQFRMRQLAVKGELVRQVQELSSQRHALADYSNNLRSRCELLERHIAGQEKAPAVALLAALTALGRPEEDLDKALSRAISLSIAGGQASVFATDGLRLEKLADSGWPETRTWSTGLTAVHPLYRAIVERQGSVSVLDPAGEAALAGEGLAAVPIRPVVGGPVVGMLKLENSAPAALSSDTVVALEAMAHALALRFASMGSARNAVPVVDDLANDAASPGRLRSFFARTLSWKPAALPDTEGRSGNVELLARDGQAGRPRAVR